MSHLYKKIGGLGAGLDDDGDGASSATAMNKSSMKPSANPAIRLSKAAAELLSVVSKEEYKVDMSNVGTLIAQTTEAGGPDWISIGNNREELLTAYKVYIHKLEQAGYNHNTTVALTLNLFKMLAILAAKFGGSSFETESGHRRAGQTLRLFWADLGKQLDIDMGDVTKNPAGFCDALHAAMPGTAAPGDRKGVAVNLKNPVLKTFYAYMFYNLNVTEIPNKSAAMLKQKGISAEITADWNILKAWKNPHVAKRHGFKGAEQTQKDNVLLNQLATHYMYNARVLQPRSAFTAETVNQVRKILDSDEDGATRRAALIELAIRILGPITTW